MSPQQIVSLVSCPYCGATRGAPCRNRYGTGKPIPPHSSRTAVIDAPAIPHRRAVDVAG